ncbi:MAG: hypothetical protein H8E55_51785 [Pelagibacterales bacterium]|nr:hypothetical protein [Pelagibacterales bacterium]
MAKINVRSPYFVNLSTTNLTSAKLEVLIYTGAANTTWVGSPQYTLEATAIDDKVSFEIAELIKDYIPALLGGTSTEFYTTVYVDYQVTESISSVAQTPTQTYGLRAFYGYGYFQDEANPQLDVMALQSNTTIIKNADGTVTIPIDNENITTFTYLLNSVVVYTYSYVGGLKIEDQIVYLTNTTLGVPYDVDEAQVTDGVDITTITIKEKEECKYTPYMLTFINKFGAYQEIWFFKNSQLMMGTTKTSYKSNILTNGSYKLYDPQVKLLSKNGNQELTLTSDYYPEAYNEIFRQLFLSEKVWIEYEGNSLGVNIENRSIKYQTTLTEKLISYTIDVSFAFDTINNIR